jgi:hypothetical protein
LDQSSISTNQVANYNHAAHQHPPTHANHPHQSLHLSHFSNNLLNQNHLHHNQQTNQLHHNQQMNQSHHHQQISLPDLSSNSRPLPSRQQTPLPSSTASLSLTQGQQRTTPSTQPAVPTSSNPPPLAGINQRKSRKRKALQVNPQPPPAPRSHEELLKESEAQLAIQARKNSKKAMSDADRRHFAEFYRKQRKLLIIEAIERCVLLPMVDGFLWVPLLYLVSLSILS